MTKPFEKTTNLAIEISSNPPIQTMPNPFSYMAKHESKPDPKQAIPASVNTPANPDLGFFEDKINPDLPEPSGSPFPSSYKEIISQSNTYRGFDRS